MDAADIIRQALDSVLPRAPNHASFHRKVPPFSPAPLPDSLRDDSTEGEGSYHRIAHTLTACCRCRQRKTRCDPSLPRCLPCERSGSTCEYFDTIKGKKISRSYVVKLQVKVRELGVELSRFTDDDNDYPRSREELVRPGGLVRLNERDETWRYLGPSSGIALTRMVMEDAKRFTHSNRIAELIPEMRARRMERMSRMQSIAPFGGSVSGPSGRKKSYPMFSACPAQNLPTRPITAKLMDVFYQRAAIRGPILHEKAFAKDLEAVYNGDGDPYRKFVVQMVLAISLQKLDTQYAGLADSYYLAAMQSFEDVVRPKDLKTLQCLLLLAHYSLLTPTDTAVYYVVGLATRICQQLGLCEEKTITLGTNNPKTLDMRRRLSWSVASLEIGLAQIMGRPSGFAKGPDFMNIGFFATVDDEYITRDGIHDAPSDPKKLMAIHVCKFSVLQYEVRRVLYEKQRSAPNSESHPWFAEMQHKLDAWRDSIPNKPGWSKPWLMTLYHTLMVLMYRPSPQVPKPTSKAAMRCYDSARCNITLSSQQIQQSTLDVNWVFLMTLYHTSFNAVLWAISNPDVRAAHPRDEVEDLVNEFVAINDQCSERWPGAEPASELAKVFAMASMQGYDFKDETSDLDVFLTLDMSPQLDETAAAATAPPHPELFNNSPFCFKVDSAAVPSTLGGYGLAPQDTSPSQHSHPTFRSNSIFFQRPTGEPIDRRPSYFPPDITQCEEEWCSPIDEPTPPGKHFKNSSSPPSAALNPGSLPTPPETLPPASAHASNVSLSPRDGSPTGIMRDQSSTTTASQSSPAPAASLNFQPEYRSPLVKQEPHSSSHVKQETHGQTPQTPAFTMPGTTPQPGSQQRTQPPSAAQWFDSTPGFDVPLSSGFPGRSSAGISSETRGPVWNMAAADPIRRSAHITTLGLGVQNHYTTTSRPGLAHSAALDNHFGLFAGALPPQYMFPQERQGSLSQQQQLELMNVLETDGLGEMDSILKMGYSGTSNSVCW